MGRLETLLVFVAAVPVLMLAHELTHLAAARLTGPIAVSVLSWFPARVRIGYRGDPPSTIGKRMISLAPLLVGMFAAIGAVVTGMWDWLGTQQPYYLRFLAVLLWLSYAHVSPADAKSALWPDQHGTDRTV